MKSFATTALAVSLIGISGCAQAGQSSGHDMKTVSYTHLTLPTTPYV